MKCPYRIARRYTRIDAEQGKFAIPCTSKEAHEITTDFDECYMSECQAYNAIFRCCEKVRNVK